MGNRSPCPICHSSTGLGSSLCFRCGHRTGTYERTDGYFGEAMVGQRSAVQKEIPEATLTPREFGIEALKWLYGAYIYEDTIMRQGIGYCQALDRVMIPVFNAQHALCRYQLRAVGTAMPKYLTTKLDVPQPILGYRDHVNDEQVVIVEDHLSAIRLRSQYNVICLEGTYASDDIIKYIIRYYQVAIVWLDSDAPGITARYKVLDRLRHHADSNIARNLWSGVDTPPLRLRYVDAKIMPKDPKKYAPSEIHAAIEQHVRFV